MWRQEPLRRYPALLAVPALSVCLLASPSVAEEPREDTRDRTVAPPSSHSHSMGREFPLPLIPPMGSEAHAAAIAGAVKDLSDPDLRVRVDALEALSRLEAPDSVHLVAPLLRDAHPDVRGAAARALGRLRVATHASAIAPLLHDREPRVRIAAGWALSVLAPEQHLPALVELLKDEDGMVGQAAVGILVRLATGRRASGGPEIAMAQQEPQVSVEAVARLVAPLLRDGSADVRIRAAHVLGDLGAVGYVDQVAALLSDENPAVRRRAVLSLVGLEARSYAPQISRLLDDPKVQMFALDALVKLGARESVAEIQRPAASDNFNIRRQALEALRVLEPATAADATVEGLRDPNPHVRGEALESIVKLRATHLATEVARLLLSTDFLGERVDAMRALGVLEAQEQAEAVIELLRRGESAYISDAGAGDWVATTTTERTERSPDGGTATTRTSRTRIADASEAAAPVERVLPDGAIERTVVHQRRSAVDPQRAAALVEVTALETLVRLKAGGSADVIAGFLRNGQAEVKRKAIWALAELDARPHAEAIARLLQDADRDVRRQALHALWRIGDPQQAGDVAKLLGDEDPLLRSGAIGLLAYFKAEAYAGQIAERLRDDDQDVRRTALSALETLRASAQLPALIDQIHDKDEALWHQAAGAIARLDESEARERLAGLMVDADPVIRRRTVYAIAEMGQEAAAREARARYGEEPSDQLLVFMSHRETAADLQRAVESQMADYATLIAPALADPDVWVRAEAIDALERLGARSQEDQLAKCLEDPHPMIRAKANAVLEELKNRERLRQVFTTPGPSEAELDLSQINPQQLQAVIEAQRAAEELRERAAMEQALATLQDPGVDRAAKVSAALQLAIGPGRDRLTAFLADADPERRIATIQALASRGGQADADKFVELLNDEVPDVRCAAIQALARVNGQQYEEALFALVNDQAPCTVDRNMWRDGPLGSTVGITADQLLRSWAFKRRQ